MKNGLLYCLLALLLTLEITTLLEFDDFNKASKKSTDIIEEKLNNKKVVLFNHKEVMKMNEIESLAKSMTDLYLSNMDVESKKMLFSNPTALSETYMNCYLTFKEVAKKKVNAANMQSEMSQHGNLASAFYRPGPGDLESTNKNGFRPAGDLETFKGNGFRPAGDLLYDNLPKSTLGR